MDPARSSGGWPPTDLRPWRCPRCRGALHESDGAVRCVACEAAYGRVGPVLDLRLPLPSYDFRADTDQALRLARDHPTCDAAELVRHVLSERPGWDPGRIEYRCRQILDSPKRLLPDLRGWLAPCVASGGLFLDLGCGPGMLLAAAAEDGAEGLGIDISLVWLQVAARLIAERGGRARLAAGLAEALPLADGSVAGVASLDVLEHVPDCGQYLREIGRVTRRGGSVAFTTPNRFSLSPEPHVGLWGVGWLPRRLQKPYVRWRLNDPYDSCWLKSSREIRRLFRRHTAFEVRIEVPPIAPEEIAQFPRAKAWLARTYNRLTRLPPMRLFLVCFGAFFRIVGRKP